MSEYKVNITKLTLMAWNLKQDKKIEIGQIVQVSWKQQVRYLGVKITTDMEARSLLDLNITPLMKETQKQLENWKSLKISWFGRTEAVKMEIIPKFIFVF